MLGATLSLVGLGGAASHPDNGRIAYAHLGVSGNRSQIYTMTASGAHRHRLTDSRRFSSLAPSFSPNGKRIVFVRAYKQSDLWTMDANGSRPRRLTWTKRIREVTPSWSPDGTQIVFAVEAPAAQQGIWIVRANGHTRRRLTNGVDTDPAWSPNGSEIAFQRYDAASQTFAIFVVPTGGGSLTNLIHDSGSSDLEPAWSPDGSRILFASDRGDSNQLDLWVLNVMAMSPQPSLDRITNTPSRDEHDPAWSPDGRQIIYSGEGSFHGASSSQIYVARANGSNRRIITHACGECAIINDEPSWQPLPG